MKMRTLVYSAILTLVTAGTALAQTAPANPLTAGAKRSYDIIKGYITKAADKMPEEHFAFKPTPDVRSFGALVGHIADANFVICGMVSGDLTKALADSFAFCDKTHAGMTDAAGPTMIKSFVGEISKLSFLEFNTHHDFEHYGNIVTYMRLKGLVPPSSERTQ
jgi:hypothetical protein